MNEMLDFAKALSNPERLRIIGQLAQTPATCAEIAAQLNLSAQESIDQLAFLEHVGAVAQKDDRYTISNDKLAVIACKKLARESQVYVPDEHWDEQSKKVLKAYLNKDGSIRQIPASPKLQVILNYLIRSFELNRDYTEKEVNTILRKFNEDTAGLRRDLVDAKLLARESDGSRYWRVA